jgi:hypothetical protein
MLHEPFGHPGRIPRFTCAFTGNPPDMMDTITSALRSRTGRAAGVFLGAALFTFLAGYVVLGPLALRVLSR